MEPIGFLAASCVFLTFCMQSMVALRSLGIFSNILFITYSYGAHLPPILILHCLLLPINCYSLIRLLAGQQFVSAMRETLVSFTLSVLMKAARL
jgi:CRP/FNR family transcriptional regulator, cyclic AMP receptor protein